MKRFSILLTLLIASVISSFAQGIVSGTIVDSDNRPMPGVRVEIVGRNESAYTDIDGVFSIDVPVAVSKIRISYPGYKPTEKKIKPGMVIKMGEGWECHDRGYRGFFDLNLGFGFGGKQSIGDLNIRPWGELGFTTSHGYQINRKFFIGLGSGLNLIIAKAREYETYMVETWDEATQSYAISQNYYEDNSKKFYGVQIPLFFDFRWDLALGKTFSPFIGIKAGYQFIITPGEEADFYNAYATTPTFDASIEILPKDVNGLFLQPTIGLRHSISRKRGLNIGLSMNVFALMELFGEVSIYEQNEYLGYYRANFETKSGHILMLNLGVDF